VLNTDSIEHVFFDRNGNPYNVPSHAVFDHQIINNANRKYLQPIKNFLNEIGISNRFAIQRTFALGDVLQILPIMRFLQKNGYDCYFKTGDAYISLMNKLGIETQRIHYMDNNYTLLLDGTVERDHEELRLQKYHRIDQYLSAIGLTGQFEFDWSCNLQSFNGIADDFVEKPFIVFQGSGSSPRKSLPENSINKLIKLMNVDGIRVAVVGGSEGLISQKNYDSKMTHVFFKQLRLEQLFWLIAKSCCLLCLDSAPLWISHFTSTPVISLLGTTRIEQRMIYHPLYPDGAIGIELSKYVGCKPCFESSKKCEGKRPCLHMPSERIYELIKSYINGFYR